MQLKDLLAGAGGGFNKSFPQGGASASLPGMNGGIGGGLPGAGFPERPQFQPRTLKDWQKIVGTIGDALQVAGGGRGTFLPAVMEDRQRNEAMMQQYDLAERQAEQQRANKKWEWENKPDEPTTGQRDFQWYQGLTPEEKATYDQFKPVIASTWQGPVPVSRSSLARPEIGSIVPDPRKGGQSNQPQMSAQGVPGGVTYITPEQYQANVTALGKERADAHMLRNNIRIGGQ